MNRREKHKAETLTDIMRSAEALFMEQGYEKTSMQQIASKADLTKGALYHHFESKEALFDRMCLDHNKAMMDAVKPFTEDKTLTCFERMRKVIEVTRDIGMSNISFVSEYLRLRNDEGNLILKERLRRYDKRFYAAVMAPLLKEAKEMGECDFHASPETLAIFILQLDRAVGDEINQVFILDSGSTAEKRIQEIMETLVYTLSRMLNRGPEVISELIGMGEAMHFYREVIKTQKIART